MRRVDQPKSTTGGFALRATAFFLLLAGSAIAVLSFAREAVAQDLSKPIATRLNQTGRVLTLPMAVKDGDQSLGEVIVRIAADDSVTVNVSELSERIAGAADKAVIARIAALPATQGFATLDDIRRAGLAILFDPLLQELRITFKVDQRETNDISFSGKPVRVVNPALSKPAIFSGYLNVVAGIDHNWSGASTGQAEGTTSGRLELDSAVRLFNVVLENRALYDGAVDAFICPTTAHCTYDHGAGLKRQSSRVVYDMPDARLRLQIGDTEAIGTQMQRSVETLGIALEKSTQKLAPGEVRSVTARTTLRLERNADIDVMVNGVVLQHLKLRAGTYNIRDLPLATGANQVELAITDDSGVRRVERFTTFAGTNMLRPGDFEWAVAGGLPSYLRDNEREYASGNYFATGLLRYGIFDNLTGEAHLQGDENVVMGGATVVAQSPWGVFTLQGAASTGKWGTGFAAEAAWDLANFRGMISPKSESVRLSAEYRSTDFHRPGDLTSIATGILYPEFNYWLRLAGSYSVQFDNAISATLSARYQFADDKALALSPYTVKGDRYGIDLSVSRPLTPTTTASLLVGYSNETFLHYSDANTTSGKGDLRAGLRLHIRPDDNTSISTSYDSLDRIASVSANRHSGEGVGRWDTSIDAQNFGKDDRTSAAATVGYYGNRAELRLSHYTDMTGSSLDSGLQRSSVRVGTSIAFADGVVAVGPPIRGNAFALVYPHESLKGREITVGDIDHASAIANGWGPAVVANVPAYSPYSLPIEVGDLPVGYSLGAGGFDLRAPYKAGYALRVGSGHSVSVFGTLARGDGTPVELASGFAYQPGEPARRIAVFTNAKGRFGAEGLSAGYWVIEIESSDAPMRFAFDVPKGVEGLHRVGELKPVGDLRR